MVHNPKDFRKEYLEEAEKSLEHQLLNDALYALAFRSIESGDEAGAQRTLGALRSTYDSLEELAWLEDLVELTGTAKAEGIPDAVSLDWRAGKERANKRPTVTHTYYRLIERHYDNPFAWVELGKVILNAPRLNVATREKGEESDVSDSRKAQESLFFFDQALFLDPASIDAYGSKARAFASLDRIVEGIECISRARGSPEASTRISDLKGYMKQFKNCLNEENNQFLDTKKMDSLWSKKGEMDTDGKLRYAQQLLASGITWEQEKEVRVNQALYVLHLAGKEKGNSDETRSEIAYYNAVANQVKGLNEKAKGFLHQCLSINPQHQLAQKRLADIELEEAVRRAKLENIDVTYVMPSYNTSKVEARKAIDSVLNQNFRGSIELIFIDDGSTEGATADYIRSKYKPGIDTGRIRVLRVPNTGAGNARNYGIKLFKKGNSKFLTFLDADDIAAEDRTQQLVDYLSSNPAGLVHAKAGFIWETGEPKDSERDPNEIAEQDANKCRVAHYFRKRWSEADKHGLPTFRSYACPVLGMNIMAKRDVAESAGYQNVVWKRAQDMMYIASLLRTGTGLGFLDKETILYRQRRD